MKFKRIGLGVAGALGGSAYYAKNKEKVDSALKDPKGTTKKVGKFIKDNPEDAVIYGSSYAIPGYMMKKVHSKKAKAIWGGIAAAPLGSAGVIARHTLKGRKKENEDLKN